MQLILVTNCSGAKTAEADSTLCARNLPKANLDALADEWNYRARSAHRRFVASELYNGRAFKIARTAATRARAHFFIVSAGFGLVHSKAAIPSYSLTITPNPDSILSRAAKRKIFSASEWWAQLATYHHSTRRLRSLLKRNPSSLLILAMTNPYFKMIMNELADLEADPLERVRIIGPRSTGDLPKKLSPLVMPYTNQLNDPRMTTHGTDFDFAARALSHFVDLIGTLGRMHSIEAHKEAVRGALAGLAAPSIPARSCIDDTQLLSLISSFKEQNTSQRNALRRLRDNLGYACSANRFEVLWSSTE